MERRLASSIGLLLAVGLLGPPLGAAPPALPATLADVAFVAGHWVGGEGGDLSEEVWSAPQGDSMVGMWRYVAGGRARIYEILTLTAEEGTVVLRLRHFDPKLLAREEKDRPVALPLLAKGSREAVFEGPEDGVKGAVRLTYRGTEDGGLEVVLEKEGQKQEFRFRRR